MLITLTIVLVIALLFGKITFKEAKEYVRKHTEEKRSKEGLKKREEDRGNGTEDTGAGMNPDLLPYRRYL